MKTAEIKEKVGRRLLEMMDEMGKPVWRMPWVFASVDKGFKGNPYKGINQVMCSLYRNVKGYESHLWLTDTKIKELNGLKYDTSLRKYVKADKSANVHIKVGSKAIPIIKWDMIERKDDFGNPITDKEGNRLLFPLLRWYNVFNADCIDGYDFSRYEPKEVADGSDVLTCEQYEERMLSTYEDHPVVVHGGNEAFYSPLSDTVTVPKPEQFRDPVMYASTLAHELGHSTGAKNRLNRDIMNSFGNDKYSKEELVAEFTSSMVLAMMGISESPMQSSAAYIKSWYSKLDDNPEILFDAIQQASKASGMIMGEK